MKRVALFASGGGSNLGALVDYLDALGPDQAPATVALVVTDRATAGALGRAERCGIATITVDDPSDAANLLEILTDHRVQLIVLAGYLKLVPKPVTTAFAGRIVNVHPALLPRHGGPGMYGIRVHRAVVAAGDPESGATVHFVDAEYDRGTTIVQARVPVMPGDTAESLAARVLAAEHFILPRAVHAIAEGLVTLQPDGSVLILPYADSIFASAPAGLTLSLATTARSA